MDALLDGLAAAVVPGGLVLIEETALAPVWRFRLALLQEWVSVRVLHWTEGDALHFVAADAIADRLESAGMTASIRHLSGRRVHPQFVVEAHKPLSDATGLPTDRRPTE